jgi:hypothetical protein
MKCVNSIKERRRVPTTVILFHYTEQQCDDLLNISENCIKVLNNMLRDDFATSSSYILSGGGYWQSQICHIINSKIKGSDNKETSQNSTIRHKNSTHLSRGIDIFCNSLQECADIAHNKHFQNSLDCFGSWCSRRVCLSSLRTAVECAICCLEVDGVIYANDENT